LQALGTPKGGKPVEQPAHRLPDGSLTSEPSDELLRALPSSAEPNVDVAAAQGFGVTAGFVGIHEGDNAANGFELEPPDQGLAVNNNVVAEINNSVVRFFNATTGAALTAAIPTKAFFSVSGYSVTDTQSFYDSTTNRWFLDETISNGTFYGFVVAISKTNNPLGSYWLYKLDDFSSAISGCGGKDCFPDYPKAGIDKNGLYITADLFSTIGSGPFVEAAIYAIPKSKLEAGAGLTYRRFDDPADFVVQPTVAAPGQAFSGASGGSEFLVSAPSSNQIAVLAIYNTNNIVTSIGSLGLRRIVIASENHGGSTVPSKEPNVVGPYCKSVGVTSAPTLDGGYSAFQATAQYANNNIFAALPFGAKDGTGLPRDVIAWFEVKPTLTTTALTASIVHQGVVTPPNTYSISYPALGLSKTGAGVMAMTITATSKTAVGGYPSAAILQFTGSGFMGSILVSGAGFTSDDGFTGCPKAGPGKVGRWGDYGAAVVDAASGFFYAGSEMIPNPSLYTRGKFANWGTFITQSH
jgi:hypothetical protein